MKKLLTLSLCLVLALSVMVGCTAKNTVEDTNSQVTSSVASEETNDIIKENTFEGTISNIELDTVTDVIMATIEPNEGEDVLSTGKLAFVGLIKKHNYEVGDKVIVAYGKAFSDNGNIAFDNATITE